MRAVSSLVICVLFLQTVAAQHTPTISYISQDQIKDIGESVELQCSVQYYQDYPILWIKINSSRDKVPLSSGTTVLVKDSRFSLKHDPAPPTLILRLNDIQETDAGFYQCRINTTLNTMISAEVELQVRRPPMISDNSTQSLVVSEGQYVQLECYANGYPSPRISWHRKNNAILPTRELFHRGSIMKIRSIRKQDRGIYYCVAENGIGRGARRNIYVTVEFAPVIRTWPRLELGQALQYDMDLNCYVEAYPPPDIVWYKDEVQLTNNQHYIISHFARPDEYTDSTIRVVTIEKWQYGEYVCRAINKLGTSETKIELFEIRREISPPEFSPNINYPCLQPQRAATSRCVLSKWLLSVSSIIVIVLATL